MVALANYCEWKGVECQGLCRYQVEVQGQLKVMEKDVMTLSINYETKAVGSQDAES